MASFRTVRNEQTGECYKQLGDWGFDNDGNWSWLAIGPAQPCDSESASVTAPETPSRPSVVFVDANFNRIGPEYRKPEQEAFSRPVSVFEPDQPSVIPSMIAPNTGVFDVEQLEENTVFNPNALLDENGNEVEEKQEEDTSSAKRKKTVLVVVAILVLLFVFRDKF